MMSPTTLDSRPNNHQAISVTNAERLVRRHVDRSFSIARYRDQHDRAFYYFEVSADVHNGSMIMGHYAVNSYSGTVWLIQGSVCKKISRGKNHELSRHVGTRVFGNRKPLVCTD